LKDNKGSTSKRVGRKKAASKVATSVPTEAASNSPFVWRGPEHRDDALYLAREDLLLVCLTEARGINALQAVALHRTFLREQLARQERERHAAEIEMVRLTEEATHLEQLNQQMWADVGRAYGLDFSRASYDDVTGKITVLEDGLNKKEAQDG
jgi:hypothetical protein